MFWSDVTSTSNAAVSAIFSSSPFSSCGGQPISTTVRTSCPARNRLTPTGTFLSNRMRNATALGVSQNCLNGILRHLELFRDFGHAYAIIVIIDNRVDRHPRAAQHGSAALHERVHLNQGAFRPVDLFLRIHGGAFRLHHFMFPPKTPDRRLRHGPPPTARFLCLRTARAHTPGPPSCPARVRMPMKSPRPIPCPPLRLWLRQATASRPR